jgi:Cu+-exporting ATPase
VNVQDIVVVVTAVALSGALAWFFFGPRRARAAELVGDVQQVRVTVRGGYSPDLVRVRQGVPLRIVFDRQESGECASRVVFPDFAVNRPLPAYAQTTVQLVPDRAGQFGFACGMNMVHGRLRRFDSPPLAEDVQRSAAEPRVEVGPVAPQEAVDPACGMEVDPASAAATVIVDGTTHYFCSSGCRDSFLAAGGR